MLSCSSYLLPPPMKLWEGNVFSRLSVRGGSNHVTIAHDALDITVQGPPQRVQTCSTWTALYTEPPRHERRMVGRRAVGVLLECFLVQCSVHLYLTRMHSSGMRTVCCSGRLGGAGVSALARGVSTQGTETLLDGNPPEGQNPQTGVKILPCCNYIADGNKRICADTDLYCTIIYKMIVLMLIPELKSFYLLNSKHCSQFSTFLRVIKKISAMYFIK